MKSSAFLIIALAASANIAHAQPAESTNAATLSATNTAVLEPIRQENILRAEPKFLC
ncbi:MAG: hypothetical protein ACKOVA_01555 [Novosphingobium sp.]